MKAKYRMWTGVVFAVATICAPQTNADIYVASTNAEIRVLGASSTDMDATPSGIRVFSGNTSTLFFNVEGSGTGFEVFGVADFAIPGFPGAIGISGGSTLTLFEDPASFGTAGLVNVYLAGDNNPNLIDANNNPAAGVPSYQTTNDGLASLDPAFNPFPTLLGQAMFTPTGAGSPTVIPLAFSGAELAHVVSLANSGGGVLRLLVAPGDATVAFTGAGQGNLDGAPPTLNVTFAIPEPGSLVLAFGWFCGICFARRRRRAAQVRGMVLAA